MTVEPIPQRILIIRPSALGDVCRSVCVLASLRRAWPDAAIDWVVQDTFAAAIKSHHALTNAVEFPRTRLSSWWRNPARFGEAMSWMNRLRTNRYDLVLDCQGLFRSGLMCFATLAPHRIGLRSARELAWIGYNRRVRLSSSESLPPHTVDQMMLLIEALNIDADRDMQLYCSTDAIEWWTQQRNAYGFGDEPYAIIAPTSRWPSKRWPIDRFAQLIEPLAKRGFARVIVIGAQSERDQVQQLFAKPSPFVVDLVGGTTIAQSMAVIAGASLVIANDSAPLHMAVGFNRPLVGLFGPTDPAVVGPYRCEDSVIRGYVSGREKINFKDSAIGDSLMRFISATAVIQKIDQVMANIEIAKPQAARLEQR